MRLISMTEICGVRTGCGAMRGAACWGKAETKTVWERLMEVNGFGEAGFVSSLTCGARHVVWTASPVLMQGVAVGRQMAVERAWYRLSISGLAA